MRAARFHETGGPEVIHIEEIDTPTPGPGQILIKTAASGVNPADWKQRKGFYGGPPPQTLGLEGSGTVESVGSDVSAFQKGDEVFGLIKGAAAEYAVGEPLGLAKRPASLSAQDAAGVPVAALTAWQDLFDVGQLQKGQRVLIHAASGAVGNYGVQFAHQAGATVIGTASVEHHARLKELGANQTVDYRHEKFEDVVEPVDLVIDAVGGETAQRSLKVLKEGGRMVSLTGASGEAPGKTWVAHSMSPKEGQLAHIANLLAEGKIVPPLSKLYSLDEIADAHRESETGHVGGKMIVSVEPV